MLPPPPPRRPQLPRPHLGVAVARGERSDFCESGFSRLARPSVWRGGFAAALPRRTPADNREISLFFADFGVSYCGQHRYRIGAALGEPPGRQRRIDAGPNAIHNRTLKTHDRRAPHAAKPEATRGDRHLQCTPRIAGSTSGL